MNNLNKQEFKKQIIKALACVVGKGYEIGAFRKIKMITEQNRAYADFSNSNCTLSVNINSKEIIIRITDWISIEKTFTYYNYKEEDDHYKVINKFKNDMIKNIRQSKKISHIGNYKIYLYDKEYKTYENKYYTPKGESKND